MTDTAPPLLNKGTRAFSRFEWMIAGRYLRARRKEAFISVIASLTMVGVAIGVATLIVVMSVMNGFRAELLTKILGAFGLLGPTEAVLSLATFTAVLYAGGWRWGATPGTVLLAAASGATFIAIAAGQLANALACRSWTRPVWTTRLKGNRLLGWALLVEAAVCLGLVLVRPVADLLGGTWPPVVGLAGALLTAVGVVVLDGVAKARGARRRPGGTDGAASGPAASRRPRT